MIYEMNVNVYKLLWNFLAIVVCYKLWNYFKGRYFYYLISIFCKG